MAVVDDGQLRLGLVADDANPKRSEMLLTASSAAKASAAKMHGIAALFVYDLRTLGCLTPFHDSSSFCRKMVYCSFGGTRISPIGVTSAMTRIFVMWICPRLTRMAFASSPRRKAT